MDEYTLCHDIVSKGTNSEIIQQIFAQLACKLNIDQRSTLLEVAVSHPIFCEILLKLSCHNHANKYSTYPLEIAIKAGNLDTVKLLLEYNFSSTCTDHRGRTPFIHAILQNQVEIAKLLVNNISDTFGYTPMMYAYMLHGHRSEIAQLFDSSTINMVSKNNNTVLMLLVHNYLYAKKLCSTKTPYYHSCKLIDLEYSVIPYDRLDTIEHVLLQGGDPKILNNKMHSVLDLCCSAPNKDEALKVAKILLDYDVELLNEHVFNLAIQQHFAALVKLFYTYIPFKVTNLPDNLDLMGDDQYIIKSVIQYSTNDVDLNYLLGIVAERLYKAPNICIELIRLILDKITLITVPVLDSIIINYRVISPSSYDMVDKLITDLINRNLPISHRLFRKIAYAIMYSDYIQPHDRYAKKYTSSIHMEYHYRNVSTLILYYKLFERHNIELIANHRYLSNIFLDIVNKSPNEILPFIPCLVKYNYVDLSLLTEKLVATIYNADKLKGFHMKDCRERYIYTCNKCIDNYLAPFDNIMPQLIEKCNYLVPNKLMLKRLPQSYLSNIISRHIMDDNIMILLDILPDPNVLQKWYYEARYQKKINQRILRHLRKN